MKVLGPTIWNSIPDHVVKSVSFNSFKTSLKKYLNGQYGDPNNVIVRDTNISSHRRNDRINNTRARNNNYGQLTDENRHKRFASRWDDGPSNLI